MKRPGALDIEFKHYFMIFSSIFPNITANIEYIGNILMRSFEKRKKSKNKIVYSIWMYVYV